MIRYAKQYLISDRPVPLFNKRKDGRFYAKLTLDSYALAREVDDVDPDAIEEIAKFRSKLAQIKRSMKADKITDLYHHQSVAVRLIVDNEDVALFMEQGTGKTLAALKAIEILYEMGAVQTILVVCPKRVVREWLEQASKFHIRVPIQKLDRQVNRGINVINYELLWRRGHKKFDMVVLDESHHIQSSGAKQTQFIYGIDCARKVLMTGTSGERPEHYFGQYKFLVPMMFGESMYVFKEMFTNYDRNTGAVWSLKKSMRDKFWARVHSISYWVRKDECLDLPEQIFEYSYIELPPKVKKLHDSLNQSLIGTYEGKQYVAQNKLVADGKCHQLAQGFIDGEIVHTEKLKVLKDMAINEPVIIFTSYKKEVEMVRSAFPKAGIVDGDHDDSEAFQQGKVDVLIVNYAAGSAGLNLQRASLTVFYSLTYSYRDYSQAISRTHRMGQERKCVYVHIIAEKTIDERVMQALANKEDFVMGGVTHERKLLAETD